MFNVYPEGRNIIIYRILSKQQEKRILFRYTGYIKYQDIIQIDFFVNNQIC